MAGTPADAFGVHLRRLREAAGLTQEALAERAGLSPNAIGALERGDRRHPYPRTIQVLAAALGITEAQRAELAALVPRRAGRADAPGAGRAGWLPAPATELLGREREIETATAYLRDVGVRLLTLTGPGGVGKTRLGIRAAAEVRHGFADGAWFVSLAPITDAGLVASAIMDALAWQQSGETVPGHVLVQGLRHRELLLMLDNFEQVAQAAPVVAEVLGSCPRVKVIVTSRLSLRIDGEQELPVSPLPIPSDDDRSGQGVETVPAVRLFVQRARAVRPDFALTGANAGAVAELCARLDGLPLAIELAAARSKLLSPQAMLGHLTHQLQLLTGGGPDRPPRLQTMRDAIAWSHDLLVPAERALFRRLSVFVGSGGLDAIDAIFDPEGSGAVLGDLAALADHSLVLREETADGETRIRMLEVIREYSLEQLEASGEAEAVRRSHAAYFLDLVTRARREIAGSGRREAHVRVRQDLDNLRAALAWLHGRGDALTAHRLAIAMAQFWIDLGSIGEGRGWMDRILAMEGDTPPALRIEALYWAAAFANLQDATAQATALANEALHRSWAHQHRLGAAMALTELAEATAGTDPGYAQRLVREALGYFQELGDLVREGMALGQLGRFAHRRGRHAEAAAFHQAALAIWRELDHPWGIPSALRDQGGEALAHGDHAQAWALFQESLGRWRELDERIHMGDCLSGLARVALARDDARLATVLLGAEEALNETTGYVPARGPHDELVAAAASALAPAAHAAAWAEGRGRALDDLIDEVLAMPGPPA